MAYVSEAMRTIHTPDLDNLVTRCDAVGGIREAKSDPSFSNLKLAYDTPVDTSLDPFSEPYFLQQAKLHEEISGRTLNQSATELYPIDVDFHAAGTNPYADRNMPLIARHAATVMYTMALSGVRPAAKVLRIS